MAEEPLSPIDEEEEELQPITDEQSSIPPAIAQMLQAEDIQQPEINMDDDEPQPFCSV